MKIRFMDKFRQTLLCVFIFQIISFSAYSLKCHNGYTKIIVVGDSLFKKYEASEFEKIKSVVSKSKKLIFIDFYADWCGPCKYMEKTVFVEKGFIDMLKTKFLAIKVNVDLPESRAICTQYRVDSYPTYIIIDSQGLVKIRLEGATPINNLLEEMDLALKRK